MTNDLDAHFAQVPSEFSLLSERHRLFVLALFSDARGNFEEARRIAGYKRKGDGSRLMRRADVQAAVAALRAKADTAGVMSAVEVQRLLSRVARGEETEIIIRKGKAIARPVPIELRLVAARDLAKIMGYRAPQRMQVDHQNTHRVYFPIEQPPEELEWDGPMTGADEHEREIDLAEDAPAASRGTKTIQ